MYIFALLFCSLIFGRSSFSVCYCTCMVIILSDVILYLLALFIPWKRRTERKKNPIWYQTYKTHTHTSCRIDKYEVFSSGCISKKKYIFLHQYYKANIWQYTRLIQSSRLILRESGHKYKTHPIRCVYYIFVYIGMSCTQCYTLTFT